jgi:hypothetical protein
MSGEDLPLDDVPTNVEEEPRETILYEDKRCKLTNDELCVKTYYFPFARARKLPLGTILAYGTAEQMGITKWGTKIWGMGLSDVWWALGPLNRHWHLDQSVVVRHNGKGCPVGFTPVDVQKFLSVMRHRMVR